ncbi:hypothetical protein [Saccharobesus litoralis]|nr:hypothetical protein [Saccharobesus litoralis]
MPGLFSLFVLSVGIVAATVVISYVSSVVRPRLNRNASLQDE